MAEEKLTQKELDDRDDMLMSMMFANASDELECEVLDALEKSKPSFEKVFKNKAHIYELIESLDFREEDEGELLMHACRRGDLEIVKKILSVIKTNDFKMAFRGACYGNHKEVMNWLIAKASSLQQLDIKRAELLEAPQKQLAEIKKKKYIDIEDGLCGAIAGGQKELCDKFIKMGATDTLGAVRTCWGEVKEPMLRKLFQRYKFPLNEMDIKMICNSQNFEALSFMIIENEKILSQVAPWVLQYSTEWDRGFKWCLNAMKRYKVRCVMNIELLSAFKKHVPKSIDNFIENCTKESLEKYIDLKSIGNKEDFITGVRNRIIRS